MTSRRTNQPGSSAEDTNFGGKTNSSSRKTFSSSSVGLPVVGQRIRLNVYNLARRQEDHEVIQMSSNDTLEQLKKEIIRVFSLPNKAVLNLWKLEKMPLSPNIDPTYANETLAQNGLTDGSWVAYEVSTRHTSNPIPGICGVPNMGNTSYMNSAIQCLSNIEELKQYLCEFPRPNTNKNTPLTTAFFGVIRDIWSLESTKSTPDPRAVQVYLGRLSSRFRNSQQQDVHEFMITLIDAMHEELKDEEDHSIIQEIFHGQIRSTVLCSQCRFPFVSDDLITSLALPVVEQPISHSWSQSPLTITVKDCIQAITQCKSHDQWFCNYDRCQRLTNAEKKVHLSKLPKVLIIQLKRFSSDSRSYRKIETFVHYPLDNLEFNEFVADRKEYKIILYELIAVSNHWGSFYGGHYTTYAKDHVNGKWYEFDDDWVREINKDRVINQNAYILVYQQK